MDVGRPTGVLGRTGSIGTVLTEQEIEVEFNRLYALDRKLAKHVARMRWKQFYCRKENSDSTEPPTSVST